MDVDQYLFVLFITWNVLSSGDSKNITVGYSECCSFIYRNGPAINIALEKAREEGLVPQDTNIRCVGSYALKREVLGILDHTNEFVFMTAIKKI